MNTEVKEKWLEALRSGEFEQGKAYLNRGGKFCCLGVLCEIAIQQGVEVDKHPDDDGSFAYDGELSALSGKVQDWSGVVGSLGTLPESAGGEGELLAFLNDGGATFTEIADLIEEYL